MNNYETNPTGRITYRELKEHIEKFSEEQLNMDVTVEIPDPENGNECYAAELRICDYNHDTLDDWHPVLFIIDTEEE